jgi:hypothetical protein
MGNNWENHGSRFEESARYFMGLDLGQQHDPTALATVRRSRRYEFYGHPKRPARRLLSEVYQLGYLERLPLGTHYPVIVGHVGRLLQRQTWVGNVELSIDATGVGRPVCDMFERAGFQFKAVTIVGGDTETHDGDNYRVPKIKLVSQLQALLHEGRLQIQKDLIDAEALVRELQDFRVTHTDSGRMQFGAREGKYDDLVLALAIAVWDATQPEYELESEPFIV